MPVVLTDFTNSVWCVEQPDDDRLHVGFSGHAGPVLQDALEFIATRQKQFDKFVEKKRDAENATKRRLRRQRTNSTRDAESNGNSSARAE